MIYNLMIWTEQIIPLVSYQTNKNRFQFPKCSKSNKLYEKTSYQDWTINDMLNLLENI